MKAVSHLIEGLKIYFEFADEGESHGVRLAQTVLRIAGGYRAQGGRAGVKEMQPRPSDASNRLSHPTCSALCGMAIEGGIDGPLFSFNASGRRTVIDPVDDLFLGYALV